jgi:hypothetical protein
VLDDASELVPGGDEALAAMGAVELKDEVVQHLDQFGRFLFPTLEAGCLAGATGGGFGPPVLLIVGQFWLNVSS